MPGKPDPGPRPPPPTRPDIDDCCKGGCEVCVFDFYEEELERFRAESAAWEKRNAGGAVRKEEASAMNPIIVASIQQRKRLRFTYGGKERLAEPQCYGLGARGTELLRVHQLKGGTQKEPLFDVSKMENLVALDESFTRPGPNYKKNDSAMKTIYCQL